MTLLDTHVWLWTVEGGALSGPAVEAIRAASVRGTLAISAISLWEVAMLASKERIHLQMECLGWIETSLRKARIEVVPLSADVAVESTRLPDGLHGDPADRIIVATARSRGAVLVTRDRLLLDYGARGHLNVLEA